MAAAAPALAAIEPIAARANNVKPREQFVKELAAKYGVTKQDNWNNNNNCVNPEGKKFFVIDLNECPNKTAAICKEIWEYNTQLAADQKPVKVVPVAGWKSATANEGFVSLISSLICGLFNSVFRRNRIESEYAQSFSLNPLLAPMGADIILRYNKEAQTMVWDENKRQLKVSAGVRITDAEAYLHKIGKAFRPKNPTLHVASMVGAAANSCYGPGKEYSSMTEDIVEMKIVRCDGKQMVLNKDQNSEEFELFKDGHIGAGFIVTEITFGNIVDQFKMQRTDLLYKNVEELEAAFKENDFFNKEHCMVMCIPRDILEKNGGYRYRVTYFERVPDNTPIAEAPLPEDFTTWLKLMQAELGEPLIEFVAKSKNLQPFYQFILDIAASQTYGKQQKTVQVNYSHKIAHVFPTYTDVGMLDFNIQIETKNKEHAQKVYFDLSRKNEEKLAGFAENGIDPEFNTFVRFSKGTYYPPGKGGIAHTGTSDPNHRILSFEILGHYPLATSEEFNELLDDTVVVVEQNDCIYKFHHGKNMQDHIRTLEDVFKDAISHERLERVRAGLIKICLDNPRAAPTFTEEKYNYIFGEATKHLKEAKAKAPKEFSDHRVTHAASLKEKNRRQEGAEGRDQEPIALVTEPVVARPGQGKHRAFVSNINVKYSDQEKKALGILKKTGEKQGHDRLAKLAKQELARA